MRQLKREREERERKNRERKEIPLRVTTTEEMKKGDLPMTDPDTEKMKEEMVTDIKIGIVQDEVWY